jgi:hypothetical protein
MMRKWFDDNETWIMLALLTLISALAYLPLIGQVGYLNDDWYLMYSAHAYGPKVFFDIFSVDRPARALVMIPAYALFGANPVYYNLSAYMFRLLSALAFLWSLRMLFPRQRGATFFASLLFLIYPGFLSQPNGIDYQSHILGLAAVQMSIALTIKAVLTDRFTRKVILHMASVIFGLLYLSQMEWYIGFEFFRWGCVFLLSSRVNGSFVQKAWGAIQSAYPVLASPVIFLIWRVFFFQNERTATDVNVQFEQVKLYPLQTLYHWVVQISQDLFDIFFSAWVTPISQLAGYIQRWGGVLAVVAAGLLFFIFYRYKDVGEQDTLQENFAREALVLGLFIAIGGLIPIAMVNRDVSFPAYSRYSLVGSAGVALFISATLMLLKQRLLRNGLAVLLIFISILTHHANTVKAAQQTALTKDFWWQVSWRIPQLKKNTTLIANYPGAALEEDYFVWGPANLIYYPEKQSNKYIQPGVFAAVLNRDTVNKVLVRERQDYNNRKNITTYANYRNILVITKPTQNSCLHVVDGFHPEYSRDEWESVRLIEPYSEIDHILLDETPHTPPTIVFGPEPAHNWCYYYQKADLARQRMEWGDVQEIGEQAFSQGMMPKDLIEWVPFLQAYAVNGKVERLTELALIIADDPYTSQQTCQILAGMTGLSDTVLETVDSLYCLDN